MERIKRRVLAMKQLNRTIKLKMKVLGKKSKYLSEENLFVFTEYLERQRGEKEIDFGLFLDLAQEVKIDCYHTPVNTLTEEIEYLRNGFL